MAAVSVALAQMGHRVLVVDGDCCLRNLDLVLGFAESPIFNFMDVATEQSTLERAICVHQQWENLHLLSAPVQQINITLAHLQHLRDMAYAAGYDYLLLDGAAGQPPELFHYAAICDRALVVCTADAVSIRGAERVARALEQHASQLTCGLVVNRVRSRLIGRGIGYNIDDAIDITGLPLLGLVPEDEQVLICAATGRSILTKKRSRAAKAYQNIARRLTGQSVHLGFWG